MPQTRDITNDTHLITIVEKQITANDIRARILRMPKALVELITPEQHSVNVVFEKCDLKTLKIEKNKCFLGGVSKLYRDTGLIQPDGSFNPQKALWKIYVDKVEIILKENN